MTRNEAIKRGLDRYVNGFPCPRGHAPATWIIVGGSSECAECRDERFAQARAEAEQRRITRIAEARAQREADAAWEREQDELDRQEDAARLLAQTVRIGRPLTFAFGSHRPAHRYSVGLYVVDDLDADIARMLSDPHFVWHTAEAVAARGEPLFQWRANSANRISGSSLKTHGICRVGSIEDVPGAPPIWTWPMHGNEFVFSDRVVPAPGGPQGWTGSLSSGGAPTCPGTEAYFQWPIDAELNDRVYGPNNKLYQLVAAGQVVGRWVEVGPGAGSSTPRKDYPADDAGFAQMAATQKAAVDRAMQGWQPVFGQSPSLPVGRR